MDEDRKHFIHAAIVCIMKSHGTLTHDLLVKEVIQQAQRFVPTEILIQRGITMLIKKDYMKRTNGDVNEYSYVA